MIKWFALILVASVLCWGDTTTSAGAHENSEKVRERVLHPIDEGKAVIEVESPDALTVDDKIELDKLLEEMGDLAPEKNITGEKAENITLP